MFSTARLNKFFLGRNVLSAPEMLFTHPCAKFFDEKFCASPLERGLNSLNKFYWDGAKVEGVWSWTCLEGETL